MLVKMNNITFLFPYYTYPYIKKNNMLLIKEIAHEKQSLNRAVTK